jgi:sphingomyelin phosphodiesterase 2
LTCSEPATAQEAIDRLGMTCDSPLNSYSAGKKLQDVAKKWKGKRLDYIFYRGPEVARRRPLKWTFKPETAMEGTGTTVNDGGPSADHLEEGQPIMSSLDSAPVLTCTSSKIVLTERVPGHNFSYSDHFGLESTFQILPPKRAQGAPNGSKYLADEETTQHRPLPSHYDPSGPLINVDESTSSQPPQENSTTLSTSPFPTQPSKTETMRSALDILHGYIRSVRKTSNRQLRYFATSIVFGIALTVSSAWQPKSWIQPIWTLLGIGAGAMGATMLYVGFVWGQWESNLLREVIEEMELEQKVVEMETSAGAVQPETM